MILVRNVFQIDPGQMKEAKALAKKGQALEGSLGLSGARAMTDLTGEYYRLVFESEYKSMADFEHMLSSTFADKTWQQWYKKFKKVIRGGYREIFTIVD